MRFRNGFVALVLGVAIALTVSGVARAQTITLGFNSGWPPYSAGSDDRVKGLLVALVESIIEDRMGWEMEVVGLP